MYLHYYVTLSVMLISCDIAAFEIMIIFLVLQVICLLYLLSGGILVLCLQQQLTAGPPHLGMRISCAFILMKIDKWPCNIEKSLN